MELVNAFLAVVSFVLGSMVGSFLNVCVHRIPRGESIVHPRSRCPKCGNAIAWYDNMPILSWMVLGARCRNCREPISWQYPLVEAITGALFLFVYLRFGIQVVTPVYMALCAGLVLVTFVDLTDWTIPDEVTMPGIPIGICCSLVAMFYPASGLRIPILYESVFDALLGVVLGGGSLYLLDKVALVLLKKRGFGFGDVKLLAMLGAFFGWVGVILIIMISCLIGSLVGVAMMLTQRFNTKDSEARHDHAREGEDEDTGEEKVPEGHYLPFGPYLALAGIVVMFFGADIVAFYLDSLGFEPRI